MLTRFLQSRISALAVLIVALLPAASYPQALGTAFTYQGQLIDASVPATGVYDFEFKLFNAASGGAQIGSTVSVNDLAVTTGLFTVGLDFGATAFAGSGRFLEIGVRPGVSAGAFTTLGSRQELTPSPHSLFAVKAGSATTVNGLTCVDNQIPKWSSGAWTCGADVNTNSGGTVTSVGSGAGLSGGPIVGSGSLSIANGGVTSVMIAAGAVGETQINSAQVQARVSGSCAAGSTVQTINPDGTVVCAVDSVPKVGFLLSTVDIAGGFDPSITVGTDGLGLISYSTSSAIKVAHCSNAACSTVTKTVIDNVISAGFGTSISVGGDGLGLLAYWDGVNNDLKVAHCSNSACTAATVTTLDSVGDVGFFPSLAIGSDGLGIISYQDITNADLKAAHCSNTLCTAATFAVVDPAGGGETSIAIGTDGLALISYYFGPTIDLRVAHCSDVTCGTSTINALDTAGNLGQATSITIGDDGLGIVSYFDSLNLDLKVAHCSNVACTTATATTVDSGGDVGRFNTSIAIGPDGLALVSYYDTTNTDLKVAHCSNALCTASTNTFVDRGTSVGFPSSVTIGADGLALIAYRDAANQDLKVAHCSNALCQPFIRRR